MSAAAPAAVDPPRPGFQRIETAVEIARPAADVFAFVTTPALWHTWHPATVEVRDAPSRPLVEGETMIERIAAAGRRFDARWIVERCVAPQLWAIAAETPRGAARIVYRIDDLGSGCRFRRALDFRSNGVWNVLDSTLIRWLLDRQSARALANLRRVLEQRADRPAIVLRLLSLDEVRSLVDVPSQLGALRVEPGGLAPPHVLVRAVAALSAGAAPLWHAFFVFVDEDRAAIVGSGGFKGPPADGRVEIGYNIAVARRGAGIATEGVKALVRIALGQPDVREVFAETAPDNAASVRVLQKAGFRATGQRNDGDEGPLDGWLLARER